ncbi:MAG: hypothetical protein ABIP39_15055 [Polyangiaceae bacterium]
MAKATSLLVVGALALFLGARALGACDNETTHFFLGQHFDSTRGCLDPEGSIAQVDGPVPEQACPATCVVGPSGLNGNASSVYVSTMCGPYPAFADTSGDPAGCTEALAALDRGDTCLIDGDSSAPAQPMDDDAGDDSAVVDDSGEDAAVD